MYMVFVLLVVLLATVLALFGGPLLSKTMNHTSFPGANHKRDSFCRHVQLTDKMYSTNFRLGNHLFHIITFLVSMPIDLENATPWCASATQCVRGS